MLCSQNYKLSKRWCIMSRDQREICDGMFEQKLRNMWRNMRMHADMTVEQAPRGGMYTRVKYNILKVWIQLYSRKISPLISLKWLKYSYKGYSANSCSFVSNGFVKVVTLCLCIASNCLTEGNLIPPQHRNFSHVYYFKHRAVEMMVRDNGRVFPNQQNFKFALLDIGSDKHKK